VIRAIISDFGGVLTTPLFGGFAKVMEAQGLPIEALGHAMVRASEAHGENPLFDFERGKMTEQEFFVLLGDGLEAEIGRRVPLQDFAEHYFSHLSPNHELIDHLRTLRDDRGLRLALLTNNVKEWEPRWKSMLPEDLFELIVDSAFVGMRKPEPGIYELTLERLRLSGPECAFIDDLDINCEAAKEHGIVPIRFESTDQVIRDLDAVLTGAERSTPS
jgi:epoxide hydrolase-like predicted phosphatase